MTSFLLRAALTGVALWLVTRNVPGIYFVGGHTPEERVGVVFVVAVIFGVVNAVIKPVVKLFALPLTIVTLGLFHVVINAGMLWLTARITEQTTGWGLHIDHFWFTAIWAAILLSIFGWALGLIPRAWERR